MTDTADFIESFLEHKYDSEKAHEYYMRTRQLKGRPRVEEDEVPTHSPSGAQLVDYDGTGPGRALYSDGSTYDGRGWNADRVSRGGSIERDEQQSNNSNRTPRARSRNERDEAQAQTSVGNTYSRSKSRNERDEEQSDRSNKGPSQTRIAREERLAEAQKKLDKARAAAKKASPSKRKQLESKLNAIEKKVKGLSNPFGKKDNKNKRLHETKARLDRVKQSAKKAPPEKKKSLFGKIHSVEKKLYKTERKISRKANDELQIQTEDVRNAWRVAKRPGLEEQFPRSARPRKGETKSQAKARARADTESILNPKPGKKRNVQL